MLASKSTQRALPAALARYSARSAFLNTLSVRSWCGVLKATPILAVTITSRSPTEIGARKGSLQPISQQRTIRQASQRVMKRQLLQLPLEGLALGDVAAGEDNPGYGRLIEKVVDDHLEVMPGTVREEEAELSRHICARLIQGLVQKCLG